MILRELTMTLHDCVTSASNSATHFFLRHLFSCILDQSSGVLCVIRFGVTHPIWLAQKRVMTSWLDFALEAPSSDVEDCESGEYLLGFQVGEEFLCEISDSDCPGAEQVTEGQDLLHGIVALW